MYLQANALLPVRYTVSNGQNVHSSNGFWGDPRSHTSRQTSRSFCEEMGVNGVTYTQNMFG